jgi:hypothetical protein
MRLDDAQNMFQPSPALTSEPTVSVKNVSAILK